MLGISMRGTHHTLRLGAVRHGSTDALAYGFKTEHPQTLAESGFKWVKEKMFSWKEVIVIGVSVVGMNLRTNERIDGVNTRIDSINTRIDGINTRIDGLSETVSGLRVAQAKTDGQVELISHKVDHLTTMMQQLLDNQNRRWLGIF